MIVMVILNVSFLRRLAASASSAVGVFVGVVLVLGPPVLGSVQPAMVRASAAVMAKIPLESMGRRMVADSSVGLVLPVEGK
ncbi:hypothetical protein [Paractinoplanes ferrugineus]|uniref:hypothetical protein n=1 Tax=Paractinoplanes ferrugineus TaxID=113564 RepID=UPI001941D6D9|nr:hypothetical protein [Actinoplanes ferrugineus]